MYFKGHPVDKMLAIFTVIIMVYSLCFLFGVIAYASEDGEVLEPTQAVTEEAESETGEEPPEIFVEDIPADESAAENAGALGTPDDWPEWLGVEPSDSGPMVYEYADESEPDSIESDNAAQLARIEYHLSVISGGVILAVCSLYTWFMIIKPIKSFVIF